MARCKRPEEYSFRINNPLMIVMQSTTPFYKLRTPRDTYELCKDILDSAQECFQVITLNARNNVIDRHLCTLGLLDSALIHPREVFRHAISDSAAAVVLVHNHPSGDPSPSAEDIRITKQLIEAGRIIDIKVLDHVIIGRRNNPNDNPFCSLRECGMCNFT